MSQIESVFKHMLIAWVLLLLLIISKSPIRNKTFNTVMFWIVSAGAVVAVVDVLWVIGGFWK